MRWTLILLILGHWIIANAMGLVSLVLSFTALRHGRAVLVSGALAVLYGLFLGLTSGIPRSGLAPIHVLSWTPMLFGAIALWRMRSRAGDAAEST